MSEWTLFSNHGHVLVCLARDNEARLRGVAHDVGITERAVQKIVKELQEAGYVSISKHGRCNRYEINTRKCMRHTLEAKCTVGRLLQLFRKDEKRVGKVSTAQRDQKEIAAPVTAIPGIPTEREIPLVKARSEEISALKKEKSTETKTPPDTREQGSLF